MATATREMAHEDVRSLVNQDLQHLIHPLHNRSDHLANGGPMIFESGEGCYLRDVEGHEYLDVRACLWNVNVGHGRRELAQAAAEQMTKLAYCSGYTGYGSRPLIELSTKLASVAPAQLNATFFTCGGAESNECSLKIARFYHKINGKPTKQKIIARLGSYHGTTAGAVSATGQAIYWRDFPTVPGYLHIPAPYRTHCELCKGEPKCSLKCADELEAAILREGADTVAAFIGEPIIANTVMVPDPGYWPRIRQICDKYDVLLIADEVITGFGRTGKWFGMMNWDAPADIMSFAKGITSGYLPLGGSMVSDKIRDAMAASGDKFMHATTYSGHPSCCAVGLANLAIFERENLVENARAMGEYMLGRLEKLRANKMVGDVRGLGLICGVEVFEDTASLKPFPAEAKIGEKVAAECLKRSALFGTVRSDIIAIAPALIINKSQCDTIADVLDESIKAVQAQL